MHVSDAVVARVGGRWHCQCQSCDRRSRISERRGLTRRICADLDLATDFTRCQLLIQGDGCRCWPLTSMEAAVVNPSTMRIGSARMRSDSPTSPNRQTRVSPQPDQHGGAGHLHMGAQAVRLVGCSGSKPMTPPSGIARAISRQ